MKRHVMRHARHLITVYYGDTIIMAHARTGRRRAPSPLGWRMLSPPAPSPFLRLSGGGSVPQRLGCELRESKGGWGRAGEDRGGRWEVARREGGCTFRWLSCAFRRATHSREQTCVCAPACIHVLLCAQLAGRKRRRRYVHTHVHVCQAPARHATFFLLLFLPTNGMRRSLACIIGPGSCACMCLCAAIHAAWEGLLQLWMRHSLPARLPIARLGSHARVHAHPAAGPIPRGHRTPWYFRFMHVPASVAIQPAVWERFSRSFGCAQVKGAMHTSTARHAPLPNAVRSPADHTHRPLLLLFANPSSPLACRSYA